MVYNFDLEFWFKWKVKNTPHKRCIAAFIPGDGVPKPARAQSRTTGSERLPPEPARMRGRPGKQ
ncbi:MAG: hypothetical protein GQ533_10915 [Methanosarcinaceae archaeon]|nr:hypothetical protein [Methanosarcinaceae archaeon]